MRNPLDAEYLGILEALASGVTPTDAAAKDLVAMGILQPAPVGWHMTDAAKMRLQMLRAARDAKEIELASIDVSSWSASGSPTRDP